MNKEQQELLGDAYKNYLIEDAKVLPNMSKEKMTEMGLRLTQEEFINKCKTEDALSLKWREEYRNLQYGSKEEIEHLSKHYTSDTEFSERWGLKIEERELSLEERTKILISKSDNKKDFYDRNGRLIIEDELVLNESNIPTKLITITYNDKTIESYE